MCDRAVTGVKPAWHKSIDCEEERVVDRWKRGDIKKGRGRKGGSGTLLEWQHIQQCDSDDAGGAPFCLHSLLCSFTVFAQGKNTLFYIYAHGITQCAHSHSNHTAPWDTQWTHVTTQLDLGRKALNPLFISCPYAHAHANARMHIEMLSLQHIPSVLQKRDYEIHQDLIGHCAARHI